MAPQKVPGGFITHLDFVRQGQRRDTPLVTDHQINRPEPLMEGQMAAVHDGVSRK